MNRKIIYRILSVGAFVIVLVGILLPGLLLIRYRESELNQVTAAPAEYYSAAGSAMARSASAKQSAYQKLQLITGKWESQLSEASSYEMEWKDYEAVAAARESMKKLYEQGLYPSNISTDYGNWYNWEASPYKAVDAIFQTYTAYYWEIHFSRYDNSEKHTVFILEDGTIFLAEGEYAEEFDDTSLTDAADYLQSKEELEVTEKDTEGERIADWVLYSNVDTAGLHWKSLAEVVQEEETCFVLQACSNSRYLYSVTPQ